MHACTPTTWRTAGRDQKLPGGVHVQVRQPSCMHTQQLTSPPTLQLPLPLQGWTPLHSATSSGREKVVATLLELGVEVDAVNSGGQTPLHYAVSAWRGAGHHMHVVGCVCHTGACGLSCGMPRLAGACPSFQSPRQGAGSRAFCRSISFKASRRRAHAAEGVTSPPPCMTAAT